MQYISYYHSPIGNILLASDNIGLTGLWFENQKYYAYNLDQEHQEKELPIFEQTKKWLDIYFSGKEPNFTPSLHMVGTPFQITVWKILQQIPYGKTITYGEIAYKVAQQKGISKMSAQAIGGAVGHNGISIIVPCHRVVGTNGSLTGYAGGIDRKIKLLSLEKVSVQHYFIPKKGKYILYILEMVRVLNVRGKFIMFDT
ncbi:methylated-DNA--[protein]-cysteine S-methyltransferase [Clostridioides difficile]|uniref:methylated-DNA--[protein]-cysteine S-methyltransferase n=1 Tax=Clostridioides difficile TaxID=1496 RepID=UPI0024B0C381|nr:methylated-DNA--[protein]-cysteine S-methyltransferase [Clostridioides difficile]MDI9212236.1 methylated-DNA--[protein]-cysteine S-methyltransferase [Clostridioides difficile]